MRITKKKNKEGVLIHIKQRQKKKDNITERIEYRLKNQKI